MKEIAAAISAVMAEVGFVRKGGKIAFGATKYSFAGEKDIIRALRPAMVDHGLSMIPIQAESIRSGGGMETVRCTYLLLHTSGESIQVQVLGMGSDRGDKAIPKALTGALKYALRQTFTIETGDDPDRHASGKTLAEIAETEAKRAEAARRAELGLDESGHTAFWRASAKAVCARLGEIGTPYREVAEWTESVGQGRPSGWAEERVRGLVGKLADESSPARQQFEAWRKKPARSTT